MKALLSPLPRTCWSLMLSAALYVAGTPDAWAQLSVGLTATEYHGGQFHVSEHGAADGSVTSAVSGGAEPYSYAWKRLEGAMGHTNMGSTQHLSGLGGGEYRLVVTDSLGMVDSASVFLSEPALLMVMPQVTHLSCADVANGSATLTVTGGVAPYTYLWSNGDTLSSTSGLGAGQHHVTVTSAGGAQRTEYFTVNAPMALGADIMQMTWAQCSGDTVALAASAWGGTPPYSYHWSTGAFSTTVNVSTGGQYSVQVTDLHNCHATDSLWVTVPEPLSGTINYLPYPNGTPFSCDTCNDGVIQVTMTGGTQPYNVMWSTAHNGMVLHGMHADSTYHVTVTDMQGCMWQSDTIIAERGIAFEQPLGVFLFAHQYAGGHHVSHSGASDGMLEAVTVGGMPPYTLLWNTGDTIAELDSLPAGPYTVTVTDQNGTQRTRSKTLTAPPPLSVSMTGGLGSCMAGGGQMNAFANGGAPPYTYEWYRNDSLYDSTHNYPYLYIYQSGVYRVRVADANTDTVTTEMTVNAIAPLTTTLTAPEVQPGHHAVCHGDTVQLTLTVSGGTEPYMYMWEHGSFQKNPKVTGGGWKAVRVTDMMGCQRDDSMYVNIPGPIVPDMAPFLHPDGQAFSCDTCNDGILHIEQITGGVPPYSILWSDGSTGYDMTGIHADSTIGITITDALGCVFADEGSLPRGNISGGGIGVEKSEYPGGYNVSCAGCMDGWIELYVSGGTAPYTFLWDDGDSTQNRYGLGGGSYHVIVTDAQGNSGDRHVYLLEPAGGLSVSLSSQAPGCNSAEGHIYAHVNGGTPPYSYQWSRNDSLYDGTYQFSHLSIWEGGNYSVRVTDANSDTVTSHTAVGSAVPLFTDLTATEVQPGHHATCHGDTVQLTLTVTGGMEPFMYMWEHGSFQRNPKVTSGGWKVVRVNDMQGCTVVDSLYINMPMKLENRIHPYVYPNGQGFSCDTCNDGKFVLDSIFGGVPPYAHQWSDGSTGDTLHGIIPDTVYSITMTDALGCSTTESGSLPREWNPEPPELTMTYDRSYFAGGYHVSCAACMDGWIQLWPSGGTPPYTYQWMDGDSAQSRYGLMAGYYSVTVTDSEGQSLWRDLTLLGPGGGLSAHINNNATSCRGTVSGSLNAMVMGGVPPYTYQWQRDGMPLMDMWENLYVSQTGMYRVTVTDMNGQTAVDSVQVGMGSELTVTAEAVEKYGDAHAGCTVADGELVLHLSGGMPPYNVNVSSRTERMSNHVGTAATAATGGGSHWLSTMDTVAVLDSLPAGYYHISVSGMNGGCYSHAEIELRSPDGYVVTTTPAELLDGNYASCDTCADVTVNAAALGAWGTVQYAWVQVPEEQTPIRLRGASLSISEDGRDVDASLFDGTDPSVFGTGAQQTGLSTETLYMVATMDELGCMGQAMFTVERPKAEVAALPAWGLYGNTADGATPPPTPPPGGGVPAPEPWLGTGDSTDVVMKANGVPQLRLGANGVTSLEGQLRLMQLQEAAFDTTGPQLKLMVADGDGVLAKVGADLLWAEMSKNPGDCFSANPQSLEVTGQWFSGVNKLYTCPPVDVGIGTNAPLAKLDVRGQAYSQTLSVGTYGQDAKVTIKAGASTNALEVQGADGMPALQVQSNGITRFRSGQWTGEGDRASIELGDFNAVISGVHSKGLSFSTWDAQDAMTIAPGGKVSIGGVNDGPHSDYRLGVNGKILAKEVLVTLDHWSDFVFDKDYRLRPLSEVQAYIAEHGHLPDVPSAKEVIEKGNNLGEMDAILLQKIEELTLYMLQMDKRMIELEEENTLLKLKMKN